MRVLKADRLYNLGDYKHIQFTDELEVPEEWDKPEIVTLLRWMQVLSIEKSYHDYMLLTQSYNSKQLGHMEAEKYINELMSETTKQLNELFKNGKTEN